MNNPLHQDGTAIDRVLGDALAAALDLIGISMSTAAGEACSC